MRKFLSIVASALAVLTINACGGEEPLEPNDDGSKLPELKAAFAANSFECGPGEKLSLPFTVTNVEGAILAFSVSSSSTDAKVSYSTSNSASGTVEFTAPDYSTGESITVTLTVNDPANKRVAEAKTDVKVAESEPLTIALASDIRTMSTKPSGSFELPVALTGVLSTVSVDQLTLTSGWTGTCTFSNEIKDGTSTGVIKVTAPGALTNSLEIKLKVKDAKNRTAEMTATIGIIEITTSENAANCYIAAPGSTLTIKGVKGNSAEKLTFNNAVLVWQDAKGLVKSVGGNGTEGVVVVQLNPGVTGNAVVAAKDGDKVVWSWHVWVITFDPTAEPMPWTGQKDGKTYKFMDGDLGAMSNTKYDISAFGLLYQWGRKDPFLGADGVVSNAMKSYYDIDGNEIYETAETRPVFEDHTSTTLELSIENPMTFYSAPSSAWPVVDWLTDEAKLQNNDAWGGVSGYKSIYDPCPYGWKIPAGGDPWGFRGQYKKAGKLNDDGKYDSAYPWFIEYDDEYCIGFRYKPADSQKEWWFPFTGKRDCNSGVLSGVGGGAQYHTSTIDGNCVIIELLAWGNPSSESPLNRPYGSAVRCIKDE